MAKPKKHLDDLNDFDTKAPTLKNTAYIEQALERVKMYKIGLYPIYQNRNKFISAKIDS